MKTNKLLMIIFSLVFSSAIFGDDAAIFKKKCGSCHTLSGVSKGKIGPDLTGYAAKRPEGFIKEYSQDPDSARKKYADIYKKEIEGKYKSKMPATKVSEADMTAILNVLK